MSLFTDGAITSIEELTGHDTQLLAVAAIVPEEAVLQSVYQILKQALIINYTMVHHL